MATVIALVGWGLFLWMRHRARTLSADITDLAKRAQTFQLVAENAKDGLLLQAMDSRIIWANRSYCEMLGYDLDEIIDRYPLEFVMPPDLAPDPDAARRFDYRDHLDQFDGYVICRNIKKTGEEFYNQMSLSLVTWDAHHEDGALAVLSCRDVTERITQEQELRETHERAVQLSRYDSLTGLANRAWFGEQLSKALAKAVADKTRIALCLVDLDEFKEVNDTFGHAAGDAVLKHVSQALTTNASETLVVGRLGGDEFCFFVIDPPVLSELADQARLIQREISKTLQWETTTISPSATIGIAVSQPGETEAEGLTKRADFALYAAKTKKRGTVGVFDSVLRYQYERERRIREDLATALDKGALDFQFQPIVDGHENRTQGLETLVRWTHPEFGPIFPDVFIPLVHEMGRMPELDFFAARAALRLMDELKAQGICDFYVSVNVSPSTLTDPMFLDFVLWEVEKLDIDRSRLRLEILETVFFSTDQDTDESVGAVRRLKNEGFTVMLDDFGVGYAGLSHLAHLDVYGIKIDRSLIAPLPEDKDSLMIVDAIVALAQKLHLTVVAEGLESQLQVECLRDIGCHVYQGYAFSRPMPAHQVPQWFTRHARPMDKLVDPRAKAS